MRWLNAEHFSNHSLKAQEPRLYPLCRQTPTTEFGGAWVKGSRAGLQEEVLMTNINSTTPVQSSFSNAVIGVLTGVMIALTGFLTFAQFVSV